MPAGRATTSTRSSRRSPAKPTTKRQPSPVGGTEVCHLVSIRSLPLGWRYEGGGQALAERARRKECSSPDPRFVAAAAATARRSPVSCGGARWHPAAVD